MTELAGLFEGGKGVMLFSSCAKGKAQKEPGVRKIRAARQHPLVCSNSPFNIPIASLAAKPDLHRSVIIGGIAPQILFIQGDGAIPLAAALGLACAAKGF